MMTKAERLATEDLLLRRIEKGIKASGLSEADGANIIHFIRTIVAKERNR